MTAKKAIKITIEDNDQNKEKTVKKPLAKAKKAAPKALKPKKPGRTSGRFRAWAIPPGLWPADTRGARRL